MQEVQQWKQLHPYFESPQQALTIAAPQQLQNSLPQKAYEQLLHWADGKTSLRRLSRRLQRNLGTLARGLYPYVERGWLHPIMTISPSISKTKKPSMYNVLLLNDDYTPMEFVVMVLEKIFNKKQEEATQIMLHVHKNGIGVCGTFTYEVAESKCKSVMDMAKKNEHPLQCTMEKS